MSARRCDLPCCGGSKLTQYRCDCSVCASLPEPERLHSCGIVLHMNELAALHLDAGRGQVNWTAVWPSDEPSEVTRDAAWDAALDAWQKRLTRLGDWAANEAAKALHDGDAQAAEWYADLHARWRWQAGALYLCGSRMRRLKVVMAGGMMASLGAYAAIRTL